ncbi:MAG: GntR family transcriptional regulator [Bacillota bacterium]|jgi:DNA-binding GntR family transcriptional regulator
MTNDKLVNMMAEYQDMPLRDVVFHTLRKAILRGDLKPDERLMEIKLAERMGVSRTPIREAIRLLQMEGLVVNIPRKGAHVAKITEKDLRDVLEVRGGLENMAVQLASRRITEKQYEELVEAARKFEEAVEKESLIPIAEADEQFHALIYEATDNRRLVQMLNNIRDQMYRYRVEYLKDEDSRKLLVEEHRHLCEVLKEKKGDEAAEIMKLHIDRQEKYILDAVVGGEQQF